MIANLFSNFLWSIGVIIGSVIILMLLLLLVYLLCRVSSSAILHSISDWMKWNSKDEK